jgi:Flp pilus assembly protein TadG
MRNVNLYSRHSDERGTIVVELAFVLPILLFLFVGVVNYGLILREYQIVQNAAREGARLSILRTYRINQSSDQAATLAAIKARVVDYASQENITINPADVTVDQNRTIDMGGGITGFASQVTVTYTRPLLIGNGWPFGPVALKGEAIFQNLD